MQSNESVVAIVLAGGRGKRLGIPKAELMFLGEPLIQRVAVRLQEIAERIVVVAASGQIIAIQATGGVSLIHDSREDRGPLAGLHEALQMLDGGLAIAVGCDMPFIDVSVIQRQIDLLEDHDAVVPILDGYPQSLHAVYRVARLHTALSLLDQGERSLRGLLAAMNVRYLQESEWLAFCPDRTTFMNINTPADLERATRLANGTPP